jgi:hypothetical protein
VVVKGRRSEVRSLTGEGDEATSRSFLPCPSKSLPSALGTCRLRGSWHSPGMLQGAYSVCSSVRPVLQCPKLVGAVFRVRRGPCSGKSIGVCPTKNMYHEYDKNAGSIRPRERLERAVTGRLHRWQQGWPSRQSQLALLRSASHILKRLEMPVQQRHGWSKRSHQTQLFT